MRQSVPHLGRYEPGQHGWVLFGGKAPVTGYVLEAAGLLHHLNNHYILTASLLVVSEIKNKLEQLRALDNNMKINVAFAKFAPIGVDTKEDLEAVKKIMENKS